MTPSELETFFENLKKLPGEFKSLLEKRVELFAIEVGEKITGLITNTIYRVFGVVFLSLGMILVLFATAKLAGEFIGSEAAGFFVVATPVLIIGALFFYRKPTSMVEATRDKMLAQFLNEFSGKDSVSSEDDKPESTSEQNGSDKSNS